jgi:hypothetical protein
LLLNLSLHFNRRAKYPFHKIKAIMLNISVIAAEEWLGLLQLRLVSHRMTNGELINLMSDFVVFLGLLRRAGP